MYGMRHTEKGPCLDAATNLQPCACPNNGNQKHISSCGPKMQGNARRSPPGDNLVLVAATPKRSTPHRPTHPPGSYTTPPLQEEATTLRERLRAASYCCLFVYQSPELLFVEAKQSLSSLLERSNSDRTRRHDDSS